MADPHDGAFDRLEVVVNRLTLQLQEDAREFVDRLAKLETIPGEIGRFREEVRRAIERAVTKDELESTIKLAIAEHVNEELQRRGSHSVSMGPNTKFKLEDRKDNRKFWLQVIGLVIGGILTIVTAYNTAAIKRVESKQEIQEHK